MRPIIEDTEDLICALCQNLAQDAI